MRHSPDRHFRLGGDGAMRHAIEPVAADDAQRRFHQGAFAIAGHVDICRANPIKTNVLFYGVYVLW